MAAMVAVLVVANVGSNVLVPEHLYVPWTMACTVAVLAVAVGVDGRSWAEMGLAPTRVRAGALVGGAVVALTLVVMAAGAVLPATQDLYRDDRVVGTSAAGSLFAALVRVPLGTVLLEEVAFRGGLVAMLLARTGRRTAIAASAALFGLWHVIPAWDVGTVNPTMADLFGDARVVPVTAAVMATALAHLVLWALRERSGSLLAPMLAHWATNGLGYLFAYGVTAWA